MRSVKRVVRGQRVTHIGTERIELDGGSIPTSPQHVHVDCSASAIPKQDVKTIFDGEVLTPQTVRAYQPAFSASVIGWVEAHYDDDAIKNELCGVVPIPNDRTDWIGLTIANALNMKRWSEEPELNAWLQTNRLNGFVKLAASVDSNDSETMALLGRMREAMVPGVMNLLKLSEQI